MTPAKRTIWDEILAVRSTTLPTTDLSLLPPPLLLALALLAPPLGLAGSETTYDSSAVCARCCLLLLAELASRAMPWNNLSKEQKNTLQKRAQLSR